jgi:hypothetical protein
MSGHHAPPGTTQKNTTPGVPRTRSRVSKLSLAPRFPAARRIHQLQSQPRRMDSGMPGAVSTGRLRGPEAQRELMPDTGLSRGYIRFAITAHHRYLRCILGSGRARPSAPRGEGLVSDQPPWDPWQTQGQQCPPQQPYGQPPYDAPSRPLSPSLSSFPPLLRPR